MKLLVLLGFAISLPLAGQAQTAILEPLPKSSNDTHLRANNNVLLDDRPAQPVSVPALAPKVATELIVNGHATVLDVRTPEEFATGHLQNARNLNFRAPDFAQQLAKLNPQGTYLVYCASGNRSGQAVAQMRKKGFKKATNVGGYKDLKAAGAK
ncbi:rhodanese-like domain-containing protein [Hymenobacter sp. ASUV-10]|uniref:Rhodanese-like domain-containing protein n=1 Tax=Hymenobacter aranciens TaxID=3063996 RepID=A0ABT9B6X0_9BACT|nr:rhodanese-like domain-containing protein [Hymenobacter sp. ASUV-10]MDO7873550.1 rhodanese-like domain-containing protein [Hymenobacter sp. ASUV-10]